MSTIIDALMLTLSLDASKFTKGVKEAQQTTKKFKEDTVAHGKEIETSMSAASIGVGKLAVAFLGLTAVFSGGKGMQQFMTDVTKTNSALGRFARGVNMSTKDVQAFDGAVQSIGGSAGEAQAGIQALSDSFQSLKTFGDPGVVRALAILSSKGGKRIDPLKSVDKNTMLDLAEDLGKIAKTDPTHASFLGRQLGLPPNVVSALMKGREEFAKLLEIQEKYAASTADIDAADKRQSAWQRLQAAGKSFGRTVLTAVTPALLKMNELLRRFVEWAKSQLPAVQKAFTDTFGSFDEILANIEKTLGKPNWKEWFEAIKGLGKDINNVAQWFGGWKNTLELLMGIAVLNWLSPIVTAFGLLTGYILSLVGAGPALAALFAVGGPLAALGALYGLVRPTPLNEGEDELARQRRYGQGGGAGAGAGAGSAPSGAAGGAPSETGGGAHAAESNKRPAPGEFGTPWNRQTGGAPVSGGGRASDRYGPQLPGGGKRRLMGRGSAASGASGKYRPEYKLSDADLSDKTVNTIAGEAFAFNQTSTDAVINNMLNRVGSKGWGPSGNLEQVARAPKQYEGYRRASEKEAEFIRSRIRAIASGSEPDNTSGANQYRANYIGHGGSGRWNQGRPVWSVGGNTFAYDPKAPNGPYAPYETPKDVAAAPSDTNAYTAPGAGGHASSVNGQPCTDYFQSRRPEESAPKCKKTT